MIRIDATAAVHREWLQNLPNHTGESLSQIAKKSNVAPSTLTRPLQGGTLAGSTLHAKTIAKVLNAFPGLAPPAGVASPRTEAARAGAREDAVEYRPATGDALASALAALCGQSNSITPWIIKTRALELAGYLPGDVVLVDSNATPQPNDLVCARVEDWQQRRASIVMRLFQRAAPINLLLPFSADPTAGVPLLIDDDHVMVLGVLLPHRLRSTVVRAPADVGREGGSGIGGGGGRRGQKRAERSAG